MRFAFQSEAEVWAMRFLPNNEASAYGVNSLFRVGKITRSFCGELLDAIGNWPKNSCMPLCTCSFRRAAHFGYGTLIKHLRASFLELVIQSLTAA